MTRIASFQMTAHISRCYQNKQDREAVHRDKKIDLYDRFLTKLYEIFLNDDEETNNSKANDENLVPFLKETQRKITLWSGPEVIISYAKWHREMNYPGAEPTRYQERF